MQTDDPNKRGERGVKRLGSTEDDTGKRSIFSWSGACERRCGRVRYLIHSNRDRGNGRFRFDQGLRRHLDRGGRG